MLAAIGVAAQCALAKDAVATDGAWLDPELVRWRQASYHGRKLLVSLEAEVEISFPSLDEARASLEEAREVEALQPSPGRVVAVELESRVLGGQSTTVLHADTGDAAVLQRRQVRRKKNKVRFKTLRFAEDGVEIRFHDPAPGEPLHQPEAWSRLTTRFAPHPPFAEDDLEVTEPTALFYILAAAPLAEPGDVIRIPAWSKERLVMMELEASGWVQIEVDYRRDGEAVTGAVPALQVLVDAKDLDPNSSESTLELMGLHGAIEVFLDAETRAPLLVSGRVPYVGRAHVHLDSLTTD
ncbi:MAG: hypothetical protein R3244_12910 [Thermoanaerobaculia bacterium]|nr:hypothetical protein [Thermoanaerobaculia bacterium]